MRSNKGHQMRNGVPLFKPKKGAKRPDFELINRLRDDDVPTQAARISKRRKLKP